MLLEDINKAYKGEKVEIETVTGFEIALSEEHDATPETLEKQKGRYKEIFGALDCPSLPRKEYCLPDSKAMKTYEYDMDVDGVAVEAIRSKHNVTPHAFFNAVFALALAKWNGNEESLYTTIYSGRNKASVSRSCVMLVKTLPVYAKIDETMAIPAFVQALGKQIEESQSMTLYSFADIAADLGIQADQFSLG